MSQEKMSYKIYDLLRLKSSELCLIYCTLLCIVYIGETNNLRNRTTLHNQHIRHEALRKIPLSGHTADCSDKEPKYFMFPFYQMKTESIIKRKEKEKFFIRTFLPKLNAL